MKRTILVPFLKELTVREDVIRAYTWETKPKLGDRDCFPGKGIFKLSSKNQGNRRKTFFQAKEVACANALK